MDKICHQFTSIVSYRIRVIRLYGFVGSIDRG